MHIVLHLSKLLDSGDNLSMPSKEWIAFPPTDSPTDICC